MNDAARDVRRRGPLFDLLVASQFLTRLPVPRDLNPTQEDMGRSAAWFPWVGVIIGGLGALVAHAALSASLTPGLAAVAAVAFMTLATGAFHEDGLADAFDGLGGGYTRERVLEIMRDSRIGSFGAAALALLFAARLCALWSTAPAAWTGALVAAHTAGRFASLTLTRFEPYARVEGGPGFGKPFIGHVTNGRFAFGAASTLAIVSAAGGWAGLAGLGLGFIVIAAWGRYCRKRIGGQTGDTLGAVNVIVEVVMLAALSVVHPAAVSPW